MKKLSLFGLLFLILITGCDTQKEKHIDIVNLQEVDDHPVRDLFLSSIKAFNEGKLEQFLANFAPDITMYGTDANYFGKSELRERFQGFFQQFPNMKMVIPDLTVKVLSKETVLVNFEWKLYPMGQGPAYSGIGSGIYVDTGSQWVEVLEVERVTHVDEALKQ